MRVVVKRFFFLVMVKVSSSEVSVCFLEKLRARGKNGFVCGDRPNSIVFRDRGLPSSIEIIEISVLFQRW